MRATFSNGEKLQLLLKSLKSIRANIMNSSEMSKLINRARLDELIAEATLDWAIGHEEPSALHDFISGEIYPNLKSMWSRIAVKIKVRRAETFEHCMPAKKAN